MPYKHVLYNLPRSRCVNFVYRKRPCMHVYAAYCNFIKSSCCMIIELYGFNEAINRHTCSKIVIGRKHTRSFAINKISTDAITIFLHSESTANHITCIWQAVCSNIQPVIYFIIQPKLQPSTTNIRL